MTNIFTRSPYIIEIDGASQVTASIELFIWLGYGSAPATYQYKLTKPIASSNDTRLWFDISPYINEYIEFYDVHDITTPTQASVASWANVKVKAYSNNTLQSTTTYKAFKGYTEFIDGYNFDNGKLLIDEGTYYYNSSASNKGNITLNNDVQGLEIIYQRKAKYTDLVTSTTHYETLTHSKVLDIPCVYYSTNGNKLEIVDYNTEDNTEEIVYTLYFRPKSECRYTPIQCDFINKFGAWQRTWFFKASQDTFEINQKNYNVMSTYSYPDYKTYFGQSKSFNTNAKESIKVNTDWVEENYKEVIKQLMMSEMILLDGKPVILNTKSVELFKHINQKTINYQLEFNYAYNFANNVI